MSGQAESGQQIQESDARIVGFIYYPGGRELGATQLVLPPDDVDIVRQGPVEGDNMSRDEALAVLRRKGMHLVADVLDAERPKTVIVGMDYDRQVGLLASYLLDGESR